MKQDQLVHQDRLSFMRGRWMLTKQNYQKVNISIKIKYLSLFLL
jgi:hypothetical protein